MFDVVVIGAGPAGNGVALPLAKSGLRVAVVDYRTTLGDKLCTGIVSIQCLRDFPPLVEVVHRSSHSATVVAPSGCRLRVERETPQAHIIDRVAYVSDLAEQARRAGAFYMLGRRVDDIQRTDRGVSLALSGGGHPGLEARMAVIATGFSPLLTTRLGLGKLHNYAMGVQMEVAAPDVQEVQVYLGNKFAPGFFGWLTPTAGGKALLGLLSRINSFDGLRLLLGSLESSGAVEGTLGPAKRWGVPLRSLERTVADRVLVVGDAAGQVKPTTGGGIYYSLLAGRMAAGAISSAFAAGDLSEASLRRYELGWKGLLSRELAFGARLRAIGERLSDRQMDQIVNAVCSSPSLRGSLNSVDLPFDWHGRLVQRLLSAPGAELVKSLTFPDMWRRFTRQSA